VPDDPRASLRWSLTKLRRVLNEDGDEPCLRTDGSSVFLDTNKLDVDLLHVAHITSPRCFEGASLKVSNCRVVRYSRLGAPSRLTRWIAPDR
jgi:hypothetical protein